MLLIRMAQTDDLSALVKLAHTSGGGLTTLPLDDYVLARKLERAEQTRLHLDNNGDGLFLFVLENTESGELVGVSGIETAVGLSQPWYTYSVGTIVHASSELNIYHRFPTLFLTNDHTGCSELCSLYLHPGYRRHQTGNLLSKSRFLFMAQHRQLFAQKTIAELRGVINDAGVSPFWEGLGRHFFDMDFSAADYLSAVSNKQFIAELMPRYPFYTNLLPAEAQAVIGREHQETAPARKMLEQEGFRYEGYVDIFDAGPTVEIYTDQIRAIRHSETVNRYKLQKGSAQMQLVSNLSREEFRCALFDNGVSGWHGADVESLWRQLQLQPDDVARAVTLHPLGRTT